MPGYQDRTKRLAVRYLLDQPAWWAKSDREVAAEAGVGKQLVGSVRREMIAAGKEWQAYHNPAAAEPVPVEGAYRPGGSVRGGYVYDDRGRSVRDKEWERQQRKKGRGR